MQAHQIPYHVTGGTSFFARNEIKDILAYLRILTNPDDDNAFLRIVNTPRRKIGIQTLQTLGDYAQQRSANLLACIDEVGIEQTLGGSGLERLRRFSHWLTELRTQLEKDVDITSVLRELIEDIDYESWLIQNSSSTAVAEKRLENIYFLLDQIKKESERISEDNEQLSNDLVLEQVVNKLLLRDLLDQQSEEAADNKVQIMTLHASKGLEFPHVFIMGFEEQILPHRNSIESWQYRRRKTARLCWHYQSTKNVNLDNGADAQAIRRKKCLRAQSLFSRASRRVNPEKRFWRSHSGK